MLLTGNNTYSGSTTISAGTLVIGGGGVLGGGTYAATIANSGTLVLNTSSNQTFSSAISGSGGLYIQGSGTVSLTNYNTNTYYGPTTINNGVLALTNNINTTQVLGPNSAVTINSGGTLLDAAISPFGSASQAANQVVTVNAGGMLTMPASNPAGTQMAAFAPRLTLSGGTVAHRKLQLGQWLGKLDLDQQRHRERHNVIDLRAPGNAIGCTGLRLQRRRGFAVECSRLFQQS